MEAAVDAASLFGVYAAASQALHLFVLAPDGAIPACNAAACAELAAGERMEGESAVIAVADDGEGIPAERLPGIFELFQRASTTGSGLGVGLAVVQAHRGTVGAASQGPGHGAVFSVRPPLTRP
jgi:signal transduction histidine kinase